MMRILLGLMLFFVTLSNAAAVDLKPPARGDRCPVCGMFVAPYPEWTSTILFKDGTQLYFDGAKDLFRYYFSLPTPQDTRTRDAISGIYLTDYYSTRLLAAEQLFLVIGSDVMGPMGHELIPVEGEKAASTFARDHKGQSVVRFEQLTPQMIPVD